MVWVGHDSGSTSRHKLRRPQTAGRSGGSATTFSWTDNLNMDGGYQPGIRKELLGAQFTKIAKLGIGWVSDYRNKKKLILQIFKKFIPGRFAVLACQKPSLGNGRFVSPASTSNPYRFTTF